MARFFYLRKPDHTFPVACVATEIVRTHPPTIAFAVATYNPADEGIVPFSKKEGRARSMGRLNSSKHRRTFSLPEAIKLDSSQGCPLEAMYAICEDMFHGVWHTQHPAACAAQSAARHWLENVYPVLCRPKDPPAQTFAQVEAVRGPAVATLIATTEHERVFRVDTPAQLKQVRQALRGEPEHAIDQRHDEGCPNHGPVPVTFTSEDETQRMNRLRKERVLEDDEVSFYPPALDSELEAEHEALYPTDTSEDDIPELSDEGATAVEEQEFRPVSASEDMLDRLFGPIDAAFQAEAHD